MPNRNTEGGYRYGYQGEYAEKEDIGSTNSFELRLYDSRINRWMTIDPYGQYHSPYMSMGNNWVSQVDPDGGASCLDPPCGGNGDIVMDGKTVNQLDDVFVYAQSSTSLGADAITTLGGFDYAFAGSTQLYQQLYPEFVGMNYGQMVDHHETFYGDSWKQQFAELEAWFEMRKGERLAQHLMNWGRTVENVSTVVSIGQFNVPRFKANPRVGPFRPMSVNNPKSFEGVASNNVKQHFQKHGWSIRQTKNGWSATNPNNTSDVYKYVINTAVIYSNMWEIFLILATWKKQTLESLQVQSVTSFVNVQ